MRTVLLHRMDQGREEAKAEYQKLDGKIDAVRAELKGDIHELRAELKGDIHELKGDIHRLDAAIHEMSAGMARIEVLVEEQNARNKIVLDGITALLSRQNQVEDRVDKVEDTVRKLAAARPG